jgi:hypothetical protein
MAADGMRDHPSGGAGRRSAPCKVETTMQLIAFALGAVLFAAPALAGPDCSAMKSTVPMWQIAKTFEEAGGTIRQMKVSDGCYEIYGINGDQKLEIYYDPSTGAELERETD